MRIFSVRINLDDMFARLDGLEAAEESSWLRGFRMGARGKALSPGASAVMECGHDFGRQAYLGAVAFSSQQSAKGKRRHSHGSAVAKPDLSHGTAEHQPNISPGPAISNNPIIQESKERVIQTSPSSMFDGMEADETPVEVAKPIVMEINWRDWRSHHGMVHVAFGGEDGSAEDWELIFKRYGATCLDVMYTRLLEANPGKRIYYSAALAWLAANTRKKAQ